MNKVCCTICLVLFVVKERIEGLPAEWGAVDDGAAEGDLVGVFQFVADSNASGDDADGDASGGKLAEDIEIGGVLDGHYVLYFLHNTDGKPCRRR